MKLIGILGPAGSGKTTVGKILVEKYDYKQLAYADALKDVASVMFGWDRKLLEGDTNESRAFRETTDDFWSKKFNMLVTPRIMMKHLGTEVLRECLNKDIWVMIMERRLQNHDKVVITDVRFKNEIKLINSLDGKLVEVFRDPVPDYYYVAKHANSYSEHMACRMMQQHHPDVHSSEWEWIGTKTHGQISNNGTIQDLESAVDKMLDVLYNGNPQSK